MPHAAYLYTGWQDIVPTQIRTPYWLGKDDRVSLSETIIDLFENTTVFPGVRTRLDAVLTELGVVEARDHVWPVKTEIVRRTHGYPADFLPIRMSDEERDAVLAIPTLPTALRQRLAGDTEAK